MATSSRLFEPYKSIGLVSSTVPHLVRYIDQLNKIQIITAVGQSFLVFNDKLQLVETCIAHSSDITLLASNSKFLFTAASNEIFAWKYAHRWKVKCYKDVRQSTLTHLLVLGGQLLAVDETNTLICWDINQQQIIASITFGLTNSFFISSILHPATYINKILFASQQGMLQLWNIAKQKLIYQYTGFGSCVTSMAQAPALHIIAIGHQSGLIVLHHLQQDVSLMKFKQELGPVTSIAFRTDDAANLPLMVSCSQRSGHLAIWNLEEKRLEQQMRNLHWDSIAAVSFINKQPLMVTNSNDNSLKVFIFDDLQTIGRLLFQREGHRAPPTRIKFYGDKGKFILSAGLDSTLKVFSINSERLNRSLGMASANRKLAKKKGIQHDTNILMPIVDFSTESIREKEWDNIIACHRNTAFVTSWNMDRMRMGRHKLLHDRFKLTNVNNVQAECVTLSSCGNFVIVGYNTGHIDRFNMQSGLHRCTYTDGNDGSPAHSGPVRAILCNALNQMIVSGGADKLCKVWRFSTCNNQLIGSLKLADAVNRMCLHKENQFVAIALDNFTVLVMDLDTKKKVRSFQAHRNRITDMMFDNDCRRLFISSMDSLIYIWDMVSGQLVDLLATSTPCVSFSLCASGEFLATAHVNNVGIYLWSNMSVYRKVTLQPLNTIDIENVPIIHLPTIKSDEIDEDNSDVDEPSIDPCENETDDIGIDYQYKSPEQISRQMITLSKVSSCQWKNLLNMDLIRKRNKPKEVLEKLKVAPFFLPCIGGFKPKFDLNSHSETALSEPELEWKHIDQENKYSRQALKHMVSPFAQSLHYHFRINDLQSLFSQMKCYGPSKIDAEIRSLGPESTGTIEYMLQFIALIQTVLESNRDFELSNAYMGLFVKVHMDTIRQEWQLLEKVRIVAQIMEEKWQRLQSSFDRSICLINFLRNALI